MGFRQNLASLIAGKQLPVQTTEKAVWGSGAGGYYDFMQIEDYGSGITEYTAAVTSYIRAFFADVNVARCVDLRGGAIAQVPLCVLAPSSKPAKTAKGMLPLEAGDHLASKGYGSYEKVDHDALGVLQQTNPKNWYTGTQWHRWNLASLDLVGHAASQFALDGRGIPSELYLYPPTVYTPMPDKDGYFAGIVVRDPGGGETRIPASQLYYVSTGSLTGHVAGTSRITAIRMELNLRAYSQASNYWFFRNNQRPDWILTGDFAPTEENVARLRRQINQWAGGDNRRGPLILGGGNMASHLLTTTPKDAEWIGQQRLTQEAIAAAFGVPAFLVNNLDPKYANYETAKASWWHDSLIPELDNYADQLTRNFLWRWPDARARKLVFGFNYAAIEGLAEDINKIWEREMAYATIATTAMKEGGLIPNQWRKILYEIANRLGTDPTPFAGDIVQGADRLVPWTVVPSQQAGATLLIDAMAARGPNAALVQNVPGDPSNFEGAAQELLDNQMEQAQAASKPKPAPTGKEANISSEGPTQPPVAVTRRSKAMPDPVSVRDRRLEKVQKVAAGRLKKYFQSLQIQALRALRGQKSGLDGDLPPGYWDQQQSQDDLEQIGSEMVGASGEAAYLAAAQDFGLKVSWDISNPWLPAYMGKRASLIRGIDQTTMDALIASLTEGAEKGESMDDLAGRVTDTFRDAIDNRAMTIARTETIQAYGSASLQAYREGGIEKAKMYDGDHDDEANCAAVNGSIVTLEEAEVLMTEEHPNGTRGVAPYIEIPEETLVAAAAPLPVKSDLEKLLEHMEKRDERLFAIVEKALDKPLPDIKIDLPPPPPVNVTIEKGAISTPVSVTQPSPATNPISDPMANPITLEYDESEVTIEEKDGKLRVTRKD